MIGQQTPTDVMDEARALAAEMRALPDEPGWPNVVDGGASRHVLRAATLLDALCTLAEAQAALPPRPPQPGVAQHVDTFADAIAARALARLAKAAGPTP